jgi:hypothetical protein
MHHNIFNNAAVNVLYMPPPEAGVYQMARTKFSAEDAPLFPKSEHTMNMPKRGPEAGSCLCKYAFYFG